MRIELESDEEGRPVGFTAITSGEVIGGFGEPDQLVCAPIMAGMAYWRMGNIVQGDLHVRVGIEVGIRVIEHLSPRMSQIVDELREELAA
jgi:hypothetical protein